MSDDVRVSKTLSYWLRHKPEAASLTLSPEGWADVDLVLAALAREQIEADWERLLYVVENNDKARFELSSDCTSIRARQGHSVLVNADWEKATPPSFLYHGTVERFWPAIQAEGLKPMKRHHVHLSADPETARRVGQRRGKPIVLIVDAAKLCDAGHEFFLTTNGVWLVSDVPPTFIGNER